MISPADHPAPDPVPQPGLIVGHIPVRCPLCFKRDALRMYGRTRSGLIAYYRCRRCGVQIKAKDVGERGPGPAA